YNPIGSIRDAQACLKNVIKKWPSKIKTTYLQTPGGFIGLNMPAEFHGIRAKNFTEDDVEDLKALAKEAVLKLMSPTICRQLAKKADFITIGVDVHNGNHLSHVELVFVFDLNTEKVVLVTGKTYPIPKQVA